VGATLTEKLIGRYGDLTLRGVYEVGSKVE